MDRYKALPVMSENEERDFTEDNFSSIADMTVDKTLTFLAIQMV